MLSLQLVVSASRYPIEQLGQSCPGACIAKGDDVCITQLRRTSREQECIRTSKPVTAQNADNSQLLLPHIARQNQRAGRQRNLELQFLNPENMARPELEVIAKVNGIVVEARCPICKAHFFNRKKWDESTKDDVAKSFDLHLREKHLHLLPPEEV
jgi:hypothetical protein